MLLVRLCGVILALAIAPLAHAGTVWTETDLYDFGIGKATPLGGLVADPAGNFYGVTALYGEISAEIFELSPPPSGQGAWKKTTLYKFASTDGVNQVNGGLVRDAQGNLFGTSSGGSVDLGSVFELKAPLAGRSAWNLQVLYACNADSDQSPTVPTSGLVLDSAGNLYGTMKFGGPAGGGIAFKLAPVAGTSDRVGSIIYPFNSGDEVGSAPVDGLTMDAGGNLFGMATHVAVPRMYSSAYVLSPPADEGGAWSGVPVWWFSRASGQGPVAGLTLDGAGDLLGTTFMGGRNNHGNVFELKPFPRAGALWDFVSLSAGFTPETGVNPIGRLVVAPDGKVYGALANRGRKTCRYGCGAVFELVPPAPGEIGWTRQIIYEFTHKQGGNPAGGLMSDQAGRLYGLLQYEGSPSGHGSFYRLTPSNRPD